MTATTLAEVQKLYANTYFCQVSKWGRDLNEAEAQTLGVFKVSTVPSSSLAQKTTKKTATRRATVSK